MPVTANLIFTQGVSGSAGKYFTGTYGATVTLSNETDTDVINWKYELLDVPSLSSVSIGIISDGGSPTATFTPDVAGGAYRVKLTVTGPTNSAEFTGTFFVPTTWFSWLLPAYQTEAPEVVAPGVAPPPTGQGWMKLLNNMFLQVDSTLGPFMNAGGEDPYQHLEFTGTYWEPVINLTLPAPTSPGEGTPSGRYISFGPDGEGYTAPRIGVETGLAGYQDADGSFTTFASILAGGLPSGSAYQHLEYDPDADTWLAVDDLTLRAPYGESTTRYIRVADTNPGGHLRIESGPSSTSDGGGNLILVAMNGTDEDTGPTNGGDILLQTGDGGDTTTGNVSGGSGGGFSIYVGDGGSSAGSSAAGAGGDILIQAGTGGSCSSSGAGGDAGNITLEAGGGGDSSSGTIADGGDIILNPGSTHSATATKAGRIVIGEPTADGSGAGVMIEVATGAGTTPALQVTSAGVWQYRNEGGAFANIGGGSGAGYGTYASMPAAGTAGSIYFASDSPVSQWVDDGAVYRPKVGDLLCYKPPLVSAFTGVNISGGVGDYSFTDNAGTLDIYSVAATTVQGHFYVISQTGETMYCEIAFDANHHGITGGDHYSIMGVALRESGTGKVATCERIIRVSSGITPYLFRKCIWTSPTAATQTYNLLDKCMDGTGPVVLRIRRGSTSGSKIYFEVSRDRKNWRELLGTTDTTSAFTTAPDQVGIFYEVYQTSGDNDGWFNVKHFKYGTL